MARCAGCALTAASSRRAVAVHTACALCIWLRTSRALSTRASHTSVAWRTRIAATTGAVRASTGGADHADNAVRRDQRIPIRPRKTATGLATERAAPHGVRAAQLRAPATKTAAGTVWACPLRLTARDAALVLLIRHKPRTAQHAHAAD